MLRALKSPTFVTAFIGVVAHLVFWGYTVNAYGDAEPWRCGELSCWILVYGDFPVSMLYVAGSAESITIFSAIVGSLWWAALFCFARWIMRSVAQYFSGHRQN